MSIPMRTRLVLLPIGEGEGRRSIPQEPERAAGSYSPGVFGLKDSLETQAEIARAPESEAENAS